MTITIHYFDFPGRAETARVILTYGGIEFKDRRFPREEWPAIKATLPLGVVPALEVDGKMIGQSGAIARYAAKLAGLYPEDPWEAAVADQAYLQAEDCALVLMNIRHEDKDELIKLRQEALAGPFKSKLQALERLLEGTSAGYFAGGEQPSFADLHIFVLLSVMGSGFFDGVTPTFLEAYPLLQAHRAKVASLPAIKEYYTAGAGATPMNKCFLPDE